MPASLTLATGPFVMNAQPLCLLNNNIMAAFAGQSSISLNGIAPYRIPHRSSFAFAYRRGYRL